MRVEVVSETGSESGAPQMRVSVLMVVLVGLYLFE